MIDVILHVCLYNYCNFPLTPKRTFGFVDLRAVALDVAFAQSLANHLVMQALAFCAFVHRTHFTRLKTPHASTPLAHALRRNKLEAVLGSLAAAEIRL